MNWENGTLQQASIKASKSGTLRLRTKTPVTLEGAKAVKQVEPNVIEFAVQAGKTYHIK